MHVTSYKAHKITNRDTNLFKILDRYLPKLSERCVVAVASKIVAIVEGSIVKTEKIDKETLVRKESEYFLPKTESKYHFFLTIKKGLLSANAGIDESNGNGYYVLWPKNPQDWANKIREYLSKKFNLKHIGVIITDSKTTPLRWGVTGGTIAHSGFIAVSDKIGHPDIFGRNMQVTKVNIMDGLSAAAVLVMGETNEQTPLAVISELPFVSFKDRNPTKKELKELQIAIKDDMYAPLLTKVAWEKGSII